MHFNDVYNIQEKPIKDNQSGPVVVGGASRFVTAFKQRGMD